MTTTVSVSMNMVMMSHQQHPALQHASRLHCHAYLFRSTRRTAQCLRRVAPTAAGAAAAAAEVCWRLLCVCVCACARVCFCVRVIQHIPRGGPYLKRHSIHLKKRGVTAQSSTLHSAPKTPFVKLQHSPDSKPDAA